MGPQVGRPILLVEDSPMDVDLTLEAFKEHEVANRVVVCRDGEEALHYMTAHRAAADPDLPALVLLDLRLPKVDGIVTTSRENRDIDAAYRLGVSSHIVKPVEFAMLADVVKTFKTYWLLTNEPPFPDHHGR